MKRLFFCLYGLTMVFPVTWTRNDLMSSLSEEPLSPIAFTSLTSKEPSNENNDQPNTPKAKTGTAFPEIR